ncbi:MAG: ubiquitin-like domain-containing protein [Chloroflexota bacterium]
MTNPDPEFSLKPSSGEQAGAPTDETSPTGRWPIPTETYSIDDTAPVTVLPAQRRSPIRLLLLLFIIGVSLTLLLSLALLAANLLDDEPADAERVEVAIQLGGETLNVATQARTIAELLDEQAIMVEAEDIIAPGLDVPVENGLRVTIARARVVNLTLDGATSVLRTSFESPFDILRSAGIMLGPYDRVQVDGQSVNPADLLAWPLPVDSIVIDRAVPVRIQDGTESREFYTTGDTVGDALYEAGVSLYLPDDVQPALETPITANMEIVIDRSRPVIIAVDGSTLETRVSARTVGDALAEAGVSLGGLDYAIPAEDRAVVSGMTIRVMRVTEEVITEQEELPFETIYQADAEMPLDSRAVLQAGQTGLYEWVIRVRYENDIEIDRQVEREGIVRNPQNAVIAYGTRVVVRSLQTPDGPVEYWRKLRMYATSYHPAALGGDDVTSIGERLRKGIVAIDPDIISYRLNVYVEGYGVGMTADTGGPRSTPYWIDLGYSDEDWVSWSRWVDVYVLTPVPAEIDYLLPVNERGGPIAP